MTFKPQLKRKLIITIVSFLTLWPVAHLVWATFFDLNSWKLGGWGMYARVQMSTNGTNLFFVRANGQPLDQMEVGPLIRRKRVVLFADGKTVDLETDYFGDVDPFKDETVRSLVYYIKVFRRANDVQKLVERVQMLLQNPVQADYALFFLTEPRLNIFDRYTYTDTVVYVVEADEVKKLGTYSTNEYEVGEILTLIDDQVKLAIQP